MPKISPTWPGALWMWIDINTKKQDTGGTEDNREIG